MPYLEVIFSTKQEISEILVALLEDYPFEAFEEREDSLHGYIQEDLFSTDIRNYLDSLAGKYNFAFNTAPVPEKNWNEEWESSFQPVSVHNFCRIRASFHPKMDGFHYDIVIDPKMAFGTGHHSTTFLTMEMMRDLRMQGKKVLDFGCGTGILSILASKMGADSILAVDIEEAAIENTRENANLNQVENISTCQGSLECLGDRIFDVILANVNRNVLLNLLPGLSVQVKRGGSLFLSGFYTRDRNEMYAAAKNCGFTPKREKAMNEWVCLEFIKM